MRPEELDILTDRISELENEVKRLTAERDRYYSAMSEFVVLKTRLSRARKIIKRLGGDPDKYNL